MNALVLLPPVVAIVLSLWTRQVYLSLFAGLWIGCILLVGGNPVTGLREVANQAVAVFADAGNVRVVFFCLLVGGLIALVQASGGVAGFVGWAQRRGWGTTRRGAEMLAFVTGMVIFVESSITCLATGAVARPFFDQLRLSREKLAFYCNSLSAPVCMLIPLNGWGAFILGLLAAQGITMGSVALLAEGVLYNFYSFAAIGVALAVAWFGWNIGPMKRAEERAQRTGALVRPGSQPLVSAEVSALEPLPGTPRHARDLFIPLGVMVAMIFGGLYITGSEGLAEAGMQRSSVWDLLAKASGSTSVLWAVGLGIGSAMLLYALPLGRKRVMTLAQSMALVVQGSSGLVGVTLLILFAFALGNVSRALEMGPYIISILGGAEASWWMPAAMFLVGCFVSFTLGSSWTTFAILMPIAVPLAEASGMPTGLFLGALFSGGVFGDHASPLSDTTLISAMSAASDLVDHVNTQLPYTGIAAGVALLGFVVTGIWHAP